MSTTAAMVLKMAHVSLALLSAAGFLLRGSWILLGRQAWLKQRWVRIMPHLVDTALLASGLGMALAHQISPVHHPWFAAKLLALVGYVACGSVAIRRARAGNASRPWLLLALICLALIFASVLSRRPFGLPWSW